MPETASAQQASANLQVEAQVVNGCEVNSSTPISGGGAGPVGTLNFGTHPALSTQTLTATMVNDANFTIRCTNGVNLRMQINGGENYASARRLGAPNISQKIPYYLYRDAGLSQEITVDQQTSLTFTSGQPIGIPIYGKLTLPGSLSPGTYTDSLVITLTW